MRNTLVQCLTPGCPNMSHHTYCLSCSAQEARQRLLENEEGGCEHTHSITGDYAMVKRFLPEYSGGHPQHGYMLDVCKECMKELAERPYYPSYHRKQH